jgi:hypothetical protein
MATNHRQAATAESVIAIVLLAGWISISILRSWTHRISLAVQAFALLGTLVGIFTIALGVGPRTMPDLVYHASIVAVLVSGLIVTARLRVQRVRFTALAGALGEPFAKANHTAGSPGPPRFRQG